MNTMLIVTATRGTQVVNWGPFQYSYPEQRRELENWGADTIRGHSVLECIREAGFVVTVTPVATLEGLTVKAPNDLTME